MHIILFFLSENFIKLLFGSKPIMMSLNVNKKSKYYHYSSTSHVSYAFVPFLCHYIPKNYPSVHCPIASTKQSHTMFSFPPVLSSFLKLLLPLLVLCNLLLQVRFVSAESPSKIGNGYRLISIEESPNGGLVGLLQLNQKTDIYGPDIPLLHLYVK